MVVVNRNEEIRAVDCVPIIDLTCKNSIVSELIVKACEDYGFFKVINHGVPNEVIQRMEEEGFNFFSKSVSEKKLATTTGPPTSPHHQMGYGVNNIGFNGDLGEVEYLLLHTTSPSISYLSNTISKDITKFNYALNDYTEAIRNLACEILDLMGLGLWVHPKSSFSDLIRHVQSDSLIRLNHYPPTRNNDDTSPLHHQHQHQDEGTIRFGEHSDPQILTILRSNDVGGLEIRSKGRAWVPVSPDPMAFFINVGDTLQVLTNGKFASVRHRVLANDTWKSRTSIMYFGAPPLHALVTPLPDMVAPHKPSLYKAFTWAEFKKATYSLRLGDSRLDLFRTHSNEEDDRIVS